MIRRPFLIGQRCVGTASSGGASQEIKEPAGCQRYEKQVP
jgi:hypothetical protein